MAAKQLSGVLRTYIAAGKATPSPPLGPSLGQVGSYFAFSSAMVFTRASFDFLLLLSLDFSVE